MADPKLKSARVVIAYRSDDGYSSDATFTGGPKNPRCPDPIQGLAEAHYELTRILALFGRPDLAEQSTAEAVKAVADWREQRAQAQQKGPHEG